MEHEWLARQLRESLEVPARIARAWNAASGDVSDFLEKVQAFERGIESTPTHASAPYPGLARGSP